ncbi:MAG: SufE family protein [Alphaproteobacteria bacterium]|nr:SufE family protein [Alphaproteobacteria bacterium]
MTYEQMKKLLQITDDAAQKLELVMDFGAQLKNVPYDALCSEIVGCSSFVEICRVGNNFYGRADSALVRGIVAIVVAMVDGKSPDEIKKMDIEQQFMELNLQLGAGRLNGVNSMIRFLKNL